MRQRLFPELYSKREELLAKEANIARGVNTYWLSATFTYRIQHAA